MVAQVKELFFSLAGISLKRKLFWFVELLGDFLLPPRCPLCRSRLDRNGQLCPPCWHSLNLITAPCCDRLGIPFALPDPFAQASDTKLVSARAIAHPPGYDHARAAVLYNDPARQLVHGFKYRDRHDFAGIMAQLMANAGREILENADIIVPIPLHWTRLWSRRFNQSALLASRVAKLSDIPVFLDGLERIRSTRRQVGLTGYQRQKNVAGAFSVSAKLRTCLAGSRIVLIDDVLTTGATVEAATRSVRHAGARQVDVLTFATVAETIEGAI